MCWLQWLHDCWEPGSHMYPLDIIQSVFIVHFYQNRSLSMFFLIYLKCLVTFLLNGRALNSCPLANPSYFGAPITDGLCREIAIQIRTIVSRIIQVWTIIYHGICYLLKFHILFCGSETVACLSKSCKQQNSVSQRLVISVLQKETKARKCRPLQSAKWNTKTAFNLIRSCGFKNCKMMQRNTNVSTN
jgi:hypothetical protein